MRFTVKSFLDYYSAQFKTDFERYFKTSTREHGIKCIDGVNLSANSAHPSSSAVIRPAAEAAKNGNCANSPDTNASVEKDWYFAGVYLFIVLAQKSIFENVKLWQIVIKEFPYPFVTEILGKSEIIPILNAAYQGPCGPNYHHYYRDMLNVVIPTLLPRFEQFLDREVEVAEKAAILESFNAHLQELLSSIQD